MKRIGTCLLGILLLLGFVTSCSTEKPRQANQPAAGQSQPSAQPSTASTPPPTQSAQPAPAPSAAPTTAAPVSTLKAPAGALATEKHTLNIWNNSAVAVTVTVNGVWVGQWDANTNVPLESVVQGKNEMVVELQDEPKSSITLEVNSARNGQNVNLLRLNFQGKAKGAYNYAFVAK